MFLDLLRIGGAATAAAAAPFGAWKGASVVPRTAVGATIDSGPTLGDTRGRRLDGGNFGAHAPRTKEDGTRGQVFRARKLRAIARKLAREPAVACSLSSPPAMNGGAPESAKAHRAGSRAEHAIGTMGCGTVAKAGTTVSGPGSRTPQLPPPPCSPNSHRRGKFRIEVWQRDLGASQRCSADERTRPCASPRMRYDSTGGWGMGERSAGARERQRMRRVEREARHVARTPLPHVGIRE